MIQITCAASGATADVPVNGDGSPNIARARGWKRIAGQIYSPAAVRDLFVTRVISFRLLRPVDGDWPALREALRIEWGRVAALSNWAASRLFACEAPRTPEREKLGKLTEPENLYAEACVRFPDMPKGSLSAVLHAVRGKYHQRRYEVAWLAAAALPTTRYGAPYPVRKQDWSASLAEDGAPLVSLRIGGARRTLALQRGPGFRRPYETFRRIVAGEIEAGELSLYRQRIGGGDGDVAQRESGGGQLVKHAIMVKIVVRLPRRAVDADAMDVLAVATGADCLLFATRGSEPERVWWYNADHLRRSVAGHARRLQRLSEDRKAERRVPRRRSLDIQGFTDRICHKQHNRVATVLHQAAASLVAYARRTRCGAVCYDDSQRGYVRSLPYSQLRLLIEQKCAAQGVRFEEAAAQAPDTFEVEEVQ